MARSRRGKNLRVARSHIRPGKSVKTKPVLPKKGMNQTAYESGFFDFLGVFWKNNRNMNVYELTKQVANLWTALLPQPKLSKRTLLRDYSAEFEALRREAENENDDFESNSGGSGETTEATSNTEEDSLSGTDQERPSRKRKGRKYENYEDFISKTKTKPPANNEKSKAQKMGLNPPESNKKNQLNPQDAQLQLLPKNSYLDTMVNMELKKQNKILKNLQICNPIHGAPLKLNSAQLDDIHMDIGSDDDILNTIPQHSNSEQKRAEIVKPTKTLLVKNLIEGTTHQDLEETFRLFLDDIISIKLLNGKTEARAIVVFTSIEAAERVWLQLNGVVFRRTTLDLEFVEVDSLSNE